MSTPDLGTILSMIEKRIRQTSPDFSTAKHSTRTGDKHICDAPEDIGRAMAFKESLRGENKRLSSDSAAHVNNLLCMTIVDSLIRLQVNLCAPAGVNPNFVRVCVEGKIKVPRELVPELAI